MGPASKTAANDGTAITALQKAEHAAGAMPFSSPAQSSHLPGMSPDMGMSLEIAVSLAATIADFRAISGPAKPCVTSPTAKTKADSKADIRRILCDNMRAQ
jgi:hypothetical protein